MVTKIISFCPNFSINYVSGRPFLMLPQNLGYVINLILNHFYPKHCKNLSNKNFFQLKSSEK